MRRAVLVVVIATGCGPSVGTASADGGQDEGGTGVGESDASASIEAGSAPTGQGSSTDTGATADACALADPAACPGECYPGYALRVLDDVCTTESIAVCIPGGPKPPAFETTYWALAPSGPVYLEYGGSNCSAGAQPDTWVECSGAADEPAGCACFCQQGYCPGDEDRRALDDCGLPTPCEPLIVDPRFGAYDHDAERCVLESLRDRVPGVYELIVGGSFSTDRTRFYVLEEQLWRIEQHADDVITCPMVSEWGRASECTLAPADYFAGCLEGAAPGEDCVLAPEGWAFDCAEQPPAC